MWQGRGLHLNLILKYVEVFLLGLYTMSYDLYTKLDIQLRIIVELRYPIWCDLLQIDILELESKGLSYTLVVSTSSLRK